MKRMVLLLFRIIFWIANCNSFRCKKQTNNYSIVMCDWHPNHNSRPYVFKTQIIILFSLQYVYHTTTMQYQPQCNVLLSQTKIMHINVNLCITHDYNHINKFFLFGLWFYWRIFHSYSYSFIMSVEQREFFSVLWHEESNHNGH